MDRVLLQLHVSVNLLDEIKVETQCLRYPVCKTGTQNLLVGYKVALVIHSQRCYSLLSFCSYIYSLMNPQKEKFTGLRPGNCGPFLNE